MNSRLLLPVLLGFAAVQPVSADVLSFYAATPGVAAPSGSFTNWEKTLELPQFDAALGTLTEVRLVYAGEAYQVARGENLGATPGSYGYSLSTTLAVAFDGGPLFSPDPIAFSGSGTRGGFDGVPDFGGASGFSFEQTLARGAEELYLSPSALEDFVGAGMLSYTASAFATSTMTGSGEFASQTISKASASLEIHYTYTPIPEPATLSLLIGATALSGAVLRRRGRQAQMSAG